MTRYPPLPGRLRDQLERIDPSDDRYITYHPCAVTLDDGQELDRVYIVECESYLRMWGIAPEQDREKKSVSIGRVVTIRQSAFRLPATLAARVYRAGESGMGYFVFTVKFSDGSRLAYLTGNAVDFITPPEGLTAADARKVYPGQGRDRSPQPGPDYFWCLYQGEDEG